MDIKEVRANLGRKVHYTNEHSGLDGKYIFNACIIRKNDISVFCQAELQQSPNSIFITSLESIHAIEGEQQHEH